MLQMSRWQVNITCLSETGVAWELPTTRKVGKMILKNIDQRMCMTTSSSISNTPSYYKPGGTATVIDGVWSRNITERGYNKHNMGRWSYVIFTGKYEKNFV